MIEQAIELGSEAWSGGSDAKSIANGQALAQQVSLSEWLGPLAPIALSPFFGLCILSGVATYGPDWLQDKSALFAGNSLLNSGLLFWSMLVLAVFTSLPRFSKVSKPIALSAEKLEAYSAIIIIVAMRLLTSPPADAGASLAWSDNAHQPLMLSAGFGSVSLNLMLSVFSAINVLVINTIKLFFEFMIWIVPIPAVDAVLEVANKTLCAALLGLYMFSPTMATLLNLSLLLACGSVFFWVQRRLRFYRAMIAGPLLAWLIPGWFAQRGDSFTAFLTQSLNGLPAGTPVRVQQLSPSDFRIQARWLWRSCNMLMEGCRVSNQAGAIGNELTLENGVQPTLVLAHRYWTSADARILDRAKLSV